MTSDRHVCPGGCGRLVDHAKFACSQCWFALPLDLRQAINRSWRLGVTGRAWHARAMAEAAAWFRARA